MKHVVKYDEDLSGGRGGSVVCRQQSEGHVELQLKKQKRSQDEHGRPGNEKRSDEVLLKSPQIIFHSSLKK